MFAVWITLKLIIALKIYIQSWLDLSKIGFIAITNFKAQHNIPKLFSLQLHSELKDTLDVKLSLSLESVT
jgi:hypothetical protein